MQHRPDRLPEPTRKDALGESQSFFSVLLPEAVRFVEDEDEVLDALRDLIDQIEFIARNRRIGAHDDECRVDVRDELTGCCRVGFEDRAEPWRIDKAKTGFEKRVGQERLRAENAFDVLGILSLRDEGDEIAQRDVLPSTRTEPNPSAPSRPVADYRDYGRNRDDPSWQDGLSEYRVQESRLPALELADAGDIEETLLRTRG